MQCAESAQKLFTLIGQDHTDCACVLGVRSSTYEPLGLRPVDQFDNAVVTQLESVGEFTHDGPVPSGKAFEGEHELVLLGRDAVTAHRLLAEPQVVPDAEAEPR